MNQESNNSYNDSNNEFNLYDLLYFLKRHYSKIIIFSFISVILGCFLILRNKPIYSSSAKILIEKKSDDDFGLGTLEGFSDKSAIEDKIEILKSRTIAESTIKELARPINSLALTKDGEIIYKVTKDLIIQGHSVKKGCGTISKEVLDFKGQDISNLNVVDQFGNNVDFIYYSDTDLSNGCDFSNYKELFILNTKQYQPTGYRKTFKNFLNLWGLLENSNNELDSNISEGDIKRATRNLQKATKIKNISGTNILSITIESLDHKEAEELVKTFIDSYINQEKEWANIETGSQIEFLEKQINKKRVTLNAIEDSIQNYQERQQIYSEDGNSNLLLEHFLELEAESNKESILYEDLKSRQELFTNELKKTDIPKSYELAIKDSLRSVNILIELSNTRKNNIDKQLIEYQRLLDKLPEKTKNFNRLKQDRLILDNTLVLLEEKLQASKIIFESESGPAKVIVKPQKEVEKIRPKVFINILLSLFIGFLLISGILYLGELLNNSIKTVEDLEKYGLSVLSIIPSIGSDKRKNKQSKNKDVHRRLITTEDPKSPISEAYRTLRTSIVYSCVSKESNVIMISSPGPGEGKTTTVCNLAIAYANLGKKTLLIDGDLRKPIISKVFNLNKENGLTAYIIGDNTLDQITQKTEIENLSVITSGIIPPNPSELLNSDKMTELIKDLKDHYDVILIDSPPMIAVTDALILSKLVDNFILVCRSNVTQKGALVRSIKSLNQIGGKFSGTVLNAINQNMIYGSGYYYSYYQYYYGEK